MEELPPKLSLSAKLQKINTHHAAAKSQVDMNQASSRVLQVTEVGNAHPRIQYKWSMADNKAIGILRRRSRRSSHLGLGLQIPVRRRSLGGSLCLKDNRSEHLLEPFSHFELRILPSPKKKACGKIPLYRDLGSLGPYCH
jgi:hypothetical protein